MLIGEHHWKQRMVDQYAAAGKLTMHILALLELVIYIAKNQRSLANASFTKEDNLKLITTRTTICRRHDKSQCHRG